MVSSSAEGWEWRGSLFRASCRSAMARATVSFQPLVGVCFTDRRSSAWTGSCSVGGSVARMTPGMGLCGLSRSVWKPLSTSEVQLGRWRRLECGCGHVAGRERSLIESECSCCSLRRDRMMVSSVATSVEGGGKRWASSGAVGGGSAGGSGGNGWKGSLAGAGRKEGRSLSNSIAV